VSNGVFQVPEVRDTMDQVQETIESTRLTLDDDEHLVHPYAFSDAVNALEADIKSMTVRRPLVTRLVALDT